MGFNNNDSKRQLDSFLALCNERAIEARKNFVLYSKSEGKQ